MFNKRQPDSVPDVVKQEFSAAKNNGMDSETNFINEAKIQKGSCEACAAEKPDIFARLVFYFAHAILYISVYQGYARFNALQCGRKHIFVELGVKHFNA